MSVLQLAARAGKPLAGGGGGGSGAAASPVAIAATYSTLSEPSSATSSLAALQAAELQVSSRQSSAGDLGDRQRLLAGLPPGLAAVHTRRAPGGGAAADGADPPEPPSPADSACSPQLIGAIRSFDSLVLRGLTPIKTRSRAATERGGASDGGELPPSPPAPYAERLVSPFHEGLPGLRPKMGLQPALGRPVAFQARASSGGLAAAPGAYAPYDLAAAALSSGAPARLPPGCMGSGFGGTAGRRAAAYRRRAQSLRYA